MRIAEKTLELTLCCQLGGLLHGRHWWPHPHFGPPQPLWFGLTQAQEARAGFDAATRLGNGRLLLLQFKAGRQLVNGSVRFNAKHQQLSALQQRLNQQRRLIYYVLPEITRTSQLQRAPWVVASTWFLDVGAIPPLSVPKRRSQDQHIYLRPGSGNVTIKSDPVDVEVSNGADIADQFGLRSLGAHYESFEKFWPYANLLGRNAVAVGLPERT